MSLLQQVVEVTRAWGGEREEEKSQCVALLERVGRNADSAIAIWQDALDSALPERDAFTQILWVGAERAKRLHRIHLDAKETGAALTELTGVAFKDTMGIADEIDIVQAYGQLEPGESGTDRATNALTILTERKARVSAALAVL